MAFDKDEFRKRAEAKAAQAKAKHVREAAAGSAPVVGPKPGAPESEMTAGNTKNWPAGTNDSGVKKYPAGGEPKLESLSREEKEVIAEYRKYKASKAATLAEGTKPATPEEARKARIAKLKEKAIRKQRIETVKARIVEARAKKAGTAKPAPTAQSIREQALKLKEKVATLRKSFKEDDMMGGLPQDPTAGLDPAAVTDPNAAPGAVQLPPEVAAQLQNIVSEVNALAQSAGLQPDAPADPMAGDAAAGIPAATDTTGGAPMPEAARKAAILKAIQERTAKKAAAKPAADTMVEETRARIAKRREALAKLRQSAMNEAGDGGESVGNAPEYFQKHLAPGFTNAVGEGPTVGKSAKTGDTAKPMAGPGGSTPSSIKPAKTWPTKPTTGKKTFEADETQPAEDEEKMEEGWDARHLTRVLEKKELNFKDMVKKGLLG
jgi:hypothetical protein